MARPPLPPVPLKKRRRRPPVPAPDPKPIDITPELLQGTSQIEAFIAQLLQGLVSTVVPAPTTLEKPIFCILVKAQTSSPQGLVISQDITVVSVHTESTSGVIVSRTSLSFSQIPNNSFRQWPQIIAHIGSDKQAVTCHADFNAGETMWCYVGDTTSNIEIYYVNR